MKTQACSEKSLLTFITRNMYSLFIYIVVPRINEFDFEISEKIQLSFHVSFGTARNFSDIRRHGFRKIYETISETLSESL